MHLLTLSLFGGLPPLAFSDVTCVVSLRLFASLPARRRACLFLGRLPVAILLLLVTDALVCGLALPARFGFARPHGRFVCAVGGLAPVPFHDLARPPLDGVPRLVQLEEAGPFLMTEARGGIPLVAGMTLMAFVLPLQQAL